MDVITGSHRERSIQYVNSILEEQTMAPATAATAKPKKKPRVAPHAGHVARRTLKSAPSASQAKKALRARKEPVKSRDKTKTAKVLKLLRRPEGTTLKKLIETTGWQAHSVRGFLSGTVGKKMGLELLSSKGQDKERIYSVKG
jgi:hypothetical protein